MEIDNLLDATTQEELIQWLDTYSKIEKYCWVITSVKPEKGKIQYLDAVEAALCFGWIDGIKKKISPTQTAQRLSPRTKNSSWTELNKERVRRLIRLKMMRPSGMAILPEMDINKFQIDQQILQEIRRKDSRYKNFLMMPELYGRVKIDNIQSVKKQPDLYEKRLRKFIESLDQNKMYGQWNDGGRLAERLSNKWL